MLMPVHVFALEEAAGEEPVIEETVVEEPVVEEPVVEEPAVKPKVTFNESRYRVLRSKTITPKKQRNVNLRTMMKEGYNGYSVVQGGCTDGTYAYYLMVSSKTQKGRVLKVRIKDRKVIKRSKILRICHGNGMAYDSKRKRLVVTAREERKQELTVINAKTLKVIKRQNVKYSNGCISELHRKQGLAAIAYNRKFDCYIALERVYHNLLIFDPVTFQAIGMARTAISAKYPATYQAMDADDKYVYLLLSQSKDKPKEQPYNLILALDWNSENLLPAVNAGKGEPKYIKKSWACNNDGTGRPDAVIRLKNKHEAENIYHTTSNGKEHFYLSEYYNHPKYRTTTRTVKVNGRWVKKKVKVVRYLRRENYVYDLGII